MVLTDLTITDNIKIKQNKNLRNFNVDEKNCGCVFNLNKKNTIIQDYQYLSISPKIN